MVKKFSVYIPQAIHSRGLDLLEKNNCTVVTSISTNLKKSQVNLSHCQAIIVRGLKVDHALLEVLKEVKLIVRHGVGIDNIDLAETERRGIRVENTPLANSNSVAEHTLGLILALLHNIVKADALTRQGLFNKRDQWIGDELKDKVVGIIGFGTIGQMVAEKCFLAFGAKIHVFDPYFSGSFPPYVKPFQSLDELIKVADVLSLHLPYSPKFHHMIGERELKLMPKSSFLLNVARGGLVDETALYQALVTKKIAGAALDCFENEPLPPDSDLFTLDNIIITPHIGANSLAAKIAMSVQAAEKVINYKNNSF